MRCAAVLAACLVVARALLGQDPAPSVARMRALEAAGDFAGAEEHGRAALQAASAAGPVRRAIEDEIERLRRLRREYGLDRATLETRLRAAIEGLTAEELERFDGEAYFDRRTIDGAARYANASVSNLFFRHPELVRRRKNAEEDTLPRVLLDHVALVEAAAKETGRRLVLEATFVADMSIVVAAGAARGGELVRCWMPVVRTLPHAELGRVVTTEPSRFSLDAATAPMRSLYLEATAVEGKPTRFSAVYEFTTRAVAPPGWAQRETVTLTAADRARWTREDAPHVVFSPSVEAAYREIAGGERDPARLARRFYDWIGDHVVYSYAREYATTPNLTDKTLACRYGDCGEAALLFITLCRRAGVPARWQSGWAAWPGNETMHDWAEIWLEGGGWAPVDPFVAMLAATRPPAEKARLRDFYFGGIDHFRLIANSDHGAPLSPPKAALRSDTVDFQRGEVEAGGRNVYFDQFSYAMKVMPKASTPSR